MDVLHAAWQASSRPLTATPTLTGSCTRCGKPQAALVPAHEVVSKPFTGYDSWQQPGGVGLCHPARGATAPRPCGRQCTWSPGPPSPCSNSSRRSWSSCSAVRCSPTSRWSCRCAPDASTCCPQPVGAGSPSTTPSCPGPGRTRTVGRWPLAAMRRLRALAVGSPNSRAGGLSNSRRLPALSAIGQAGSQCTPPCIAPPYQAPFQTYA